MKLENIGKTLQKGDMMEKSQKLIFGAVVAICLIAGTVIGLGICENLFPLPTKIEQKEVPFEGVMVMDDKGDLCSYQYIAKWNVYRKLPDDYEATSMTGASITYRNDTGSITVKSQYLNYWWDNPKSNETENTPSLDYCSYISSLLEVVRTEYSNGSGVTDSGTNYTISTTINYMGLKCPECGYVWELPSEDER